MVWLIFAWLTAFFESLSDVAGKKSLQVLDEYTVSFSARLITFVFLLPSIIIVGIPHIGNVFWPALLIGGSLNVVTTVLYMKALRYSDLSISVPMLTFTPLFLLVTSPLILGEFPTLLGFFGIILIVSGSYILNVKEWKQGFLAPFQALLREKGPRLMLIVAFIWSITSNFDKIGVINSSPVIWIVAVNLFIVIFLLPVIIRYVLNSKTSAEIMEEKQFSTPEPPLALTALIKQNRKNLVLLGLFSALTSIFQMYALTLTLVAYVVAIKRTSVVFSVVWGHYIFKEKGVKERLLGASIMVLGVVLIVLS